MADVDFGLRQFVFCNVEVGSDHSQWLTVFVPLNNASCVVNPDPVTVFMPHSRFAFVAFQFAFPVLCKELAGVFEVVWMACIKPGIDRYWCQLIECVANNVGPAFTERGFSGFDVPVPEANGRRFNH